MWKELSPYTNTSSFSDEKVFCIGAGPQAPRSALPIGFDPVSDKLKVTPVNIDDRDLMRSILAVSYAQELYQSVSSNVYGFVYVTEVNVQRKTITYLAPSQGILPSKFLVAGSLSWLECH
ncbi:Protein CLP1-like protein [Raphanus sativus]|nr:Protein CLP1-like protein [Raphanus sativus]